MSWHPPSESVVDRFLRYVCVDTEAREGQAHVPSSEGQWTLARQLAGELTALGAEDVRLSDACMVYAICPSNLLCASNRMRCSTPSGRSRTDQTCHVTNEMA